MSEHSIARTDVRGAPAPLRELPSLTVRMPGSAVIELAGELDMATTPALRRSLDGLLSLKPDRLVVDLSQVSFFDASAVGVLVRARATSRAAGGDLVACAPSRCVQRVLAVVGLQDLLEVGPSHTPKPPALAEGRDGLGGLIAAWEDACSDERYGAAPLAFDPASVLSALSTMLADQSSIAPAAAFAAARRDETSAATAALQLWALRDVLHAAPPDLEVALAAMASATLADLERASLMDPLTGLLNRRALDRDLQKALAVARRHAQVLSVVMIDVEGLKAVNDDLGHAAGDALLRKIGASLKAAVRTEDNAYRIGGDEFVLILPTLGPDDIDGLMERAALDAPGSFTWGAAWVHGDDDARPDGELAAILLAEADQRMLDFRDRHRTIRGSFDARAQARAEKAAELAGRFAADSRSSVVSDRAKGLVAESFGVAIAEAAAMLEAFAAAGSQSVRAVSVALLSRELDIASLAPHRPDRPITAGRGSSSTAPGR